MIEKMIEEIKEIIDNKLPMTSNGCDLQEDIFLAINAIAEKYKSQEFDIDLHETPMRFTKEQKAWIKQFVNKRCEIARQEERGGVDDRENI